jgi:hypothetical protein
MKILFFTLMTCNTIFSAGIDERLHHLPVYKHEDNEIIQYSSGEGKGMHTTCIKFKETGRIECETMLLLEVLGPIIERRSASIEGAKNIFQAMENRYNKDQKKHKKMPL